MPTTVSKLPSQQHQRRSYTYATMQLFTVVAVLSAAIAAVQGAPLSERASYYPPHYPFRKECKLEGPVEVCAINRGINFQQVRLIYKKTGVLWPQASPISAWVQVNGKSGNVGPFEGTYTEVFTGPFDSAVYNVGLPKYNGRCYVPNVADNATYTPEGIARCPVGKYTPISEGQFGKVVEDYDELNANEKNIMSAATDGTWNVQVAFRNDKNNWDSKFSANYRFTFSS